ncbi:MAG: nickel pincer cofactor biosynthesis protein LarB [Dethiobacteria bacterium]|jgi:NCAIR mutase (PurE)-related protein|nr:nickel pincer cofactor biosynthesis protein LarB [Bacillota bacterium]
MDIEKIRKLLEDVRAGEKGIEDAVLELRRLPYDDLGFAKVDHHRRLRRGFPEVIYCPGKALEHIVEIMRNLSEKECNILATRAEPYVFEAVKKVLPDAEYHALARCIVINRDRRRRGLGKILIITAGTADLPVAEEAALTAELMGSSVDKLYDAGVAGIHRLLGNRDMLDEANVIVVVAGMEGALASVVGGLVRVPVIAVPTSVGYGANFQGLAPLLTMLNSCASGVAVVNIDNGFGAGYMAALINMTKEEALK